MIIVPASMGQLNRRALLSCLQRLGPASRAELAKTLKLSQPTAGRIVEGMLREGLIVETGEEQEDEAGGEEGIATRGRAGRPGRVLRLNATEPRFLCIHMDVRETRIARMTLDPGSTEVWEATMPTPGDAREWVSELQSHASKLRLRRPLGVIVSVPGIVDEASGRVLFSPNLHWTEKVSLAELIGGVWNTPVVFIQELRALALGHQMFDASEEDFLAVDVGEGLGAAAIIKGRLYKNQLPLSGELGHTPVAGNNRRCGCGATGCLETLLSARGLMEGFVGVQTRGARSWKALLASVEAAGLPGWLADTLDAAGCVIAGAMNVFGVRKVVLTGLLGEFPQPVHTHLERAIARGAIWQRFGRIICQFAPRHRAAGMIAAGIDRCVVPENPAPIRRTRSVRRRSGKR